MGNKKVQRIFAGLLIVVGIVLLCLYALLMMNGGGPSGGMFIIGVVDLVVGSVLLRRVRAS
jgi:hypothetical protein